MSIFNIRVRKHQQRRKTKEMYTLRASYKGGTDEKFDRKLEKAAGKRSDGSGYAFGPRERDLQWDYEIRPAAKNAEKRVKKAGKGRAKVEVRTESMEE
jgi:hypothetical protein